ncbi:helix-turn-helix transcriptional regulator [bacterium]|nr:helix-turn-helix transcriptional regulator [bacterium]
MSQPLHNYLRMFRRSAGLTQKELAYLLGIHSASPISRYERSLREPSLHTLLAFELIFRTPGRRLFAGVYEDLHRRTLGRTKRLLARMEKSRTDAHLARKRETLEAILSDEGDTLDLPT